MWKERNETAIQLGKGVGFLVSYTIFTTILFFVLSLLNKMPESWTIVHVIMITLSVTIFGTLIKRWLQ